MKIQSAKVKNMKQLSFEDWKKIAIERFGRNSNKWRFKCGMCGNIQSVESVMSHNPTLKEDDIHKWIHFSCEGRHTKGYGCVYTLGGLIPTNETEIIKGNMIIPTFEFAELENGLEQLK
jgi:hypothetical protein